METIIIRIHMAYAKTLLYFFQCPGEVCVSGPICWPPLSEAPLLHRNRAPFDRKALGPCFHTELTQINSNRWDGWGAKGAESHTHTHTIAHTLTYQIQRRNIRSVLISQIDFNICVVFVCLCFCLCFCLFLAFLRFNFIR